MSSPLTSRPSQRRTITGASPMQSLPASTARRRSPRMRRDQPQARSTSVQAAGNRLGTVTGGVHNARMRKGDVICPECNAGFRRIELASRHGTAGEFHCPLCDHVLEVFDGSTEIAYRLTVAPERLSEYIATS